MKIKGIQCLTLGMWSNYILKFLEQEKKEKKFNFIDIVYNTITIQMCDVNLPFSVSFPPKHGSERVEQSCHCLYRRLNRGVYRKWGKPYLGIDVTAIILYKSINRKDTNAVDNLSVSCSKDEHGLTQEEPWPHEDRI